jgi:adenylate cyclase
MTSSLYQRIRHCMPVIALTLAITGAFVLERFGLYYWRFLDQAENILYDLRVIVTMPGDLDPRVVIVDIDERSLVEIGHWPWSRDKIARLIDRLFDDYGVAIIGMDQVFPEPDDSSGLSVLEALAEGDLAEVSEFRRKVEEVHQALDYDGLLAASLSGRPVVLGFYFKEYVPPGQQATQGVLPASLPNPERFDVGDVHARSAQGYGGNLALLQAAAAGGGHFTPWVDEDGVIRRVPMIYQYGGYYYEALSLAVVRTLLGIDSVSPILGETGTWLDLQFLRVPVDRYFQALVPYRGWQGSFPYVSAADVLTGQADPELLRDNIVLIGTTAPGLFDLRTTPVQKQYAGVEVHANLIAGILDQDIRQQPAYGELVDLLQLLVLGLMLSFVLPLVSAVWGTVIVIGMMVVLAGGNLLVWQKANLVLPLASSIILVAILYVVNMFWGFFFERRTKKQIAATFGQYVPPELIDEMNFDPGSYTLVAESRELTILFSDVRGFTTISEGLTPTELSELMNTYLTDMTRLIHDNRGTIDKYMGDAIMAFWGAPVANRNHARDALFTGLAMLERMNAVREDFVERGWPPIHIGIGINTGVVSVGNMGSRFRMAYTVLGDPVNLASRLEGLTKTYGVEIIVGENTKQAVPELVYRELDLVRVKGKAEPVAIYEPVAKEEELSVEEHREMEMSSEALVLYRRQDWDGAGKIFRTLLEEGTRPELYRLYLDRIAAFRRDPPGEDWDGVFTHTTK